MRVESEESGAAGDSSAECGTAERAAAIRVGEEESQNTERNVDGGVSEGS